MTTIPRAHQLNEIGTPLTLTVYRKDGTLEVEIDSANILRIVLSPPTGSPKVKDGIPVGANTGRMRYVTTDGDLDEVGTWDIQGYVEIDANSKWPTNTVSIEVESNLVTSFDVT